MKCSPRTDSESFSSSKEQACVNTGQDKVLIYPRGWRTRISLKWLLFQEWLTVKRKGSRLRHKISRGVICEGVTAPSAGIINSKGVCFSWDFLYDNCNINQHQSMWSNDSVFMFQLSERVALKKAPKGNGEAELVQFTVESESLCCHHSITIQHSSTNLSTRLLKRLNEFSRLMPSVFFFFFFCIPQFLARRYNYQPARE